MTTTLPTSSVVALHSLDARLDAARVYVAGTATPGKPELAEARKIAMRALHTLVGKPLFVEPGDGGAYVTYPALRSRKVAPATAAPAPSAPAVAAPAPAPVSRKAALKAAGLTAAQVSAVLAILGGGGLDPVAPAPAREVPDFIARARAVTCKCCRDLGVVRGIGSKAGQPYRTQAGADAATQAGRSVKCPDHKRAGKGKRKSA